MGGGGGGRLTADGSSDERTGALRGQAKGEEEDHLLGTTHIIRHGQQVSYQRSIRHAEYNHRRIVMTLPISKQQALNISIYITSTDPINMCTTIHTEHMHATSIQQYAIQFET